MRAVKVMWIDAYAIYGWKYEDEIDEWAGDEKNFMVETIGYVYQETDDYLVLHRGRNGIGGLMDPIRINKPDITKIEELTNDETVRTTGNEE